MSKPTILLQLDGDPQPSVFDSVVAVDAGVDHLLRHGGVQPGDVEALVHGTIFTRGLDDLRRTAIFVGGSDVGAGERLLDAVLKSFIGPFRVSVMMDSNGANTTAAAAVLAVLRHVELNAATALVLGATGPVGQRVARLLARGGARVRLGSRSEDRAQRVVESMRGVKGLEDADLAPLVTVDEDAVLRGLAGCNVLVAAGAAGVELLSAAARAQCDTLRVAVDLNAVPPVGLAGMDVTARAEPQGKAVCYGAIGVGGTKMKIHKAAVRKLFDTNDATLDAEEIFDLGRELSEN